MTLNDKNRYSMTSTYVWLDVLKKRLEEDSAPDKEIEAIECCKSIIRQKITGYAEDESNYTPKILDMGFEPDFINVLIKGRQGKLYVGDKIECY
jgi:hypothetical protein